MENRTSVRICDGKQTKEGQAACRSFRDWLSDRGITLLMTEVAFSSSSVLIYQGVA